MRDEKRRSMSLISSSTSRLRFAVIAAVLGNMLQWFDFSLFGLMLPLFTKLFFPGKATSFFLLLFALGALARPVGGLVFGYLGDTVGRKTALVRTILFMTIPILLVALLPSYQKIGAAAGILLIVFYTFQAFCVGGEFPGSIVFLEESSPIKQRGYIGSWAYFGVALGMFLVAIDVYELNIYLSSESLVSWGWRLPFYMGACIGIIGAIMRHFLHETPVFQEAREVGALLKKPLLDTFQKHKKILLKGMGIYLLDVISFNLILIYSSFYYLDEFHLGFSRSFQINLCSVLILLVMIPVMGKLGSRIGNRRLAQASAVLMFIFSYPLYSLIGLNTIASIYIGQELLVLLMASYVCNMPVLLFELYPTQIRYTCIGIAINFTVALFGGTAPLLIHYLIKLTNMPAIPGLYLMLASLVSFLSLRRISKKNSAI